MRLITNILKYMHLLDQVFDHCRLVQILIFYLLCCITLWKAQVPCFFLEKLKCNWHTDGFRISILLEKPLFNWRFFNICPSSQISHKKKKNVTNYTYSFCFKCECIPSTIKLDEIFFLKEKKIAQVFVFIWYDGIWTRQLSAGL